MKDAIRKADALIEALPYIQRFSGRPVVIKFGGNAMENPQIVDDVIEDAVFLATVGIRPVIVHGGGPHVSAAMRQAGLEPTFVHGHRVTDERALDLVVRVLAGEVSGQICSAIEAHGGEARRAFREGRSLLTAEKKLMDVRTREGNTAQVDVGYVGQVTAVDTGPLMLATAEGSIAVVPPIGQDSSGQLYNLNADTAAAAIAGALKAEKIVFLSNVHGIMEDPDDPDSLMTHLSENRAQQMVRSGAIRGGMRPKVAACISSLDAGVRKAHIVDGRLPHSLLLEIFTDRGVGTEIVQDLPPDGPAAD
jgi:acetylglutamate kinase